MDFPVQQVRIEDFTVEGRPGQAQVQFAGEQALDLLARDQFLEVDVDVGQDRGDLLQQRAQDAEAAGRREADPERPERPEAMRRAVTGARSASAMQPAGLVQEGASGGGQLDLAVVPLQQLGAHGLLQLLDLPAQRRLGHVRAVRRPGRSAVPRRRR